MEKACVFDAMVQCEFVKQHCIVVSGGGYPTILFRQVLCSLWGTFPRLNVYCLSDCDAHGLDIALMYRQGSVLMNESYLHCLPSTIRIGVTIEDGSIVQPHHRLDIDRSGINKLHKLKLFMQRKEELYHAKVDSLLQIAQKKMDDELIRQLDLQLKASKRIEIEAILATGRLEEYIKAKIAMARELYPMLHR